MKILTTDLAEISWLKHGFFTRLGGTSSGVYTSLNCGLRSEDKQTNVMANRARAAAAMGLAPENLVIAKQVHGVTAVHVTKPWDREHAPEADAMVTAEKGIGLGILTADCIPVFFVDRKEKIIGAAHAGWKGALGGVLESAVEAMQGLGALPEHIEAALGPCIGPNSYEVKDDFKRPFLEQDKKNDRFFKPSPRKSYLLFNLPGYAAFRLQQLSLRTVHDIRQDTLPNETVFFSHRRAFLRSEKGFGLQISVIAVS